MKHKTLFIVSGAVLLLAFVVGTLLHSTEQERSAIQFVESNRAALVRMHSPVLGRADAPVVIDNGAWGLLFSSDGERLVVSMPTVTDSGGFAQATGERAVQPLAAEVQQQPVELP